MQYRTFPKLPHLPISTLGFGCMRLPTLDNDVSRIDEEAATRMLRRAVDAGVNYVDTAWPYHNGMSERFLGKALRHGLREKVYLATKSPVWMMRSPSDWERILDEQLRRLETDHIDFYLMHALNADYWETVQRQQGFKAMERALADGRIGHLGFSFHGTRTLFPRILQAYDWTFCQIQYNLLDEGFQAGREGLLEATARRIGVIIMEPLRGGALARVPPAVQALWDRWPEKRTAAEWALRWLWHQAEPVTVLSGMTTEAQLEENLKVAELAQVGGLTEPELGLVNLVKAHYHGLAQVPCTTCGYCQPCPSNVAIPDVFSIFNSSHMLNARSSSSSWYKAMYVSQRRGADACVECGDCEPRCPQGIPIIEQLKMAHAHLAQ